MRTSTVRLVLAFSLASLLLAGVLTSCGGGAATKVTVTITSPSDGSRIVGSRSITLSGTLSGGTLTAFSVTLNGTAVGAATHTATTFSAPLTLDDGANTIVVTATNAAGTTTESVSVTFPFLAFSDFASAQVVIGQPNFTSAASALTASGMDSPYGDPAVVNGVFYLPDYSNDRVLGFLGGIPTGNGVAADFVLGQPDFVTDNSAATADGMDGPQTVRFAGGKLFIAGYSNNRVLVWNTPPTTTQAAADLVVGQSGFGSFTSACTASGLNGVESIFTYGTKLIIADSDNNRVVIHNDLPTSNGPAADLVLGQADFTHCTENDDNQDGTADATPSARTLYYPSDVWTDGTRLIVADSDNNRVLIWNSFPTSNFQPADVVLGQANMTADTQAAGASGMDYPYFLQSNGNQLFVADGDNNRVLIFDSMPTATATPADHVLGQSNFTNNVYNDDNQDGTADTSPSARTLSFPSGLLATDSALVVMDNNNNRVLVFKP